MTRKYSVYINMARLEKHKDLTKMHKDLMEKGFCFGQVLGIGVYSKVFENLDFKTTFKYGLNNSEFSNFGVSNFAYETDRVFIKEEIASSRAFKSTLEFIPSFGSVSLNYLKGKLVYEMLESEGRNISSASIEYSHKNCIAELSLCSDSSAKFTSNFVIEKGGVGTDLVLDTKTMKLTAYDMSLWWFTNKYRAVLKHFSTKPNLLALGNLEAFFYYDHSLKKKFAAIATYNAKKEFLLKLGLQLNLDQSRLFKARIDNGFNLGLSMRNKINNFFSIVTATQFNLFVCSSEDIQFGIKLKFNQ